MGQFSWPTWLILYKPDSKFPCILWQILSSQQHSNIAVSYNLSAFCLHVLKKRGEGMLVPHRQQLIALTTYWSHSYCQHQFGDYDYMTFKMISLVPHEPNLIDFSMFNSDQVDVWKQASILLNWSLVTVTLFRLGALLVLCMCTISVVFGTLKRKFHLSFKSCTELSWFQTYNSNC